MAVMTAPEGGWRLNVGGFIAYYRPKGWLIRGNNGSSGYVGAHLDQNGRPTKGMRPLKARTLDELAALIEAEQESGR